MGEDRTGPYSRRLTVAQAADALGISAEAVRGRIRRGTLPVEREDGAVYVLLEDRTTADPPRTTADPPTDRTDQLIAEMQDRIRSLEEANRENRRIIAALTSRIPELEAPRESPTTPAEASEGAEPRSGTEGQHAATERPFTAEDEEPRRRSWWREFFGFGG